MFDGRVNDLFLKYVYFVLNIYIYIYIYIYCYYCRSEVLTAVLILRFHALHFGR